MNIKDEFPETQKTLDDEPVVETRFYKTDHSGNQRWMCQKGYLEVEEQLLALGLERNSHKNKALYDYGFELPIKSNDVFDVYTHWYEREPNIWKIKSNGFVFQQYSGWLGTLDDGYDPDKNAIKIESEYESKMQYLHQLDKEGVLLLQEKLQEYENLGFCTQMSGNTRYYTNSSYYWGHFDENFKSIKENIAKQFKTQTYWIETPMLDDYFYENLCGKIKVDSLMPLYREEKENTTWIKIWNNVVFIDLSKVFFIKSWGKIYWPSEIVSNKENDFSDPNTMIFRDNGREKYINRIRTYNNRITTSQIESWEKSEDAKPIFKTKPLDVPLSNEFIECAFKDEYDRENIINIIDNIIEKKRDTNQHRWYEIQHKCFLKTWWENMKKGVKYFFEYKWIEDYKWMQTVNLTNELLQEFEGFMHLYKTLGANTLFVIKRLWKEILSNTSDRLLSKLGVYTQEHIPSYTFEFDATKFLGRTSRWGYMWYNEMLQNRENEWKIFLDHEWIYGKKNNQLIIIKNKLDPEQSTIISRCFIRSIKTQDVPMLINKLMEQIKEWIAIQNALNCWCWPEDENSGTIEEQEE